MKTAKVGWFVGCLAMGLGSAAVFSAERESPDLARVLGEVRGLAFRSHVEFLADDLLEGRQAGARGYDTAALYVAAQLKAMGIRPAGTGDSYFQAVPLVESRLVEGEVALSAASGGARTVLEPTTDYLQAGDAVRTESRVEAPVVFAGFGITAPELAYDDYAGLDVRGKIVAVLSNAPARFPSEPRAHFSSSRLKSENAAARGAVGMLSFATAEDAARLPWDRIVLNDHPGVRWRHPDGSPEGATPELRGRALLSPAGVRRLFASSPTPLDELFAQAQKSTVKGFALPVTAAIASRSEHRTFASPNVVGVLEGSDPVLKNTYVVYSAHLDHVGEGKPIKEDRIYNGAYDNASGVAVVLEAARALAGLRMRPRRSVLFVFVTAEEEGLLGSDYFAAHPTVPRESMVANINVDMPLFLYPLAELIAFGADNSSLDALVARAGAAAGLAVTPDPLPEENVFIRSDQYSFVRRGIPAVFLVPGFRSADGTVDGRKAFTDFLNNHYHMPSDDLRLPMDLKSAERFIQANVRLGYAVASAPSAPSWKPGNFFGKTFAVAATSP